MIHQQIQSKLVIPTDVLDQMVALAYSENPLECCGLIVGVLGSDIVSQFHPCRNIAESKIIYTLDPKDFLRIDRTTQAAGLAVIGVVHSHTHTDPYPSPTDVAQAPDPDWHYVIIGLKRDQPETRSYRIVNQQISESQIILG